MNACDEKIRYILNVYYKRGKNATMRPLYPAISGIQHEAKTKKIKYSIQNTSSLCYSYKIKK